jgi:transcriptional regulator
MIPESYMEWSAQSKGEDPSEIARLYDVPLKEVLDDVKHLRKTLKQSAYRLDVTAAECRKCTFVFSTEKLSKPSKCPQCRSTWLEEPVVQIIEA